MKQLISLSALALLAACQTVAPPPEPEKTVIVKVIKTIDEAPAAAAPVSPPATQQWLYGSAEARIALVQDWNEIARYVEAKAAARPNASVVLAPGATATAPDYLACGGDKPLAAVFDADETLIWNLGVTAYSDRMNQGFDPKVWDQWEKTGAGKAVAIPGVKDAFERIRAAGVEIIVNTNRDNANHAGTAKTLAAAGLGDFTYGQTLFLRGDAPGGSGKDGRRYLISDTYCIIALAGDQLGDITDIFNDRSLTVPQRTALAMDPAFGPMWGNGWFVLPNPVYGPSIAGTLDEVFPADTYWEPAPAE
ncbi:MAG: HAD family acid phosphatase [Hyphomonas sp.]